MNSRIGKLGAVLGAFAIAAPAASAQMIFNLTNQGGATPQMMAGFAEAAALWSARFDDPITINIRINAAALAPGHIGGTSAFFDPWPYADVRNALLGNRKSADDFSSTGNLPAGAAFPMLINRTANNPNGVVSVTPYFDTGLGGPGQAGPENNSTIRMTTANAKALGLMPGDSALLDGTITFTNLQSYDFDRSNGINAAQVDFVGVAAHEIGHLLGFISGVDTLEGNGTAPGLDDNALKFVTPVDLFRFSSRSIGPGGGIGVIDWTADDTAKYFSVDGGLTPVAAFSSETVYEASHWKNNLGLGLMDPTATVGELLSISNNDVRAFDVMGYDLVPEPSVAGVLGIVGVVWLGVRRRHRVRGRER